MISRLIDRVESGEDVIIARAGKPVVRLTRIGTGQPRTGFGSLKARVRTTHNFDAPLPKSLLRKFGAAR